MHNEIIHDIKFTTLTVSFTLLKERKSNRLLSEEQGTMVCAGFVVGKVAMEQVFLQVFSFLRQNNSPQSLVQPPTHISFIKHQCYITFIIDSLII